MRPGTPAVNRFFGRFSLVQVVALEDRLDLFCLGAVGPAQGAIIESRGYTKISVEPKPSSVGLILLDTCTFLWLSDPGARLPDSVKQTLRGSSER